MGIAGIVSSRRHKPLLALRSSPQESAMISNSPPPVPNKNKSARASASVTFNISPPLIVRVTDQVGDPVKVRVDTGVQAAGEVNDGVDVGVKDGNNVADREVDVLEKDADVLDKEVSVAKDGNGVAGREVDVVEKAVDVLDKEVSVVEDGVGVDFEETCFKGVDFKSEGIEFEEIDVDKDEFRVIDDTLEDEEVA
jgi:hypothetical protein